MNWTRKFALSLGLSVLFFLVLSNWLGLLPTTGMNLFACAGLLVLVGLYAIRIGFLAVSLGLFLALYALFADQATVALGLPQLPSGIPDDYWFTAVLPPAAAWFVFPLLARLVAARLPRSLGGVAIGLALLPLPAIRFALRPEVIADIYLRPRPGTFAMLPVPWVPLVGLCVVLASAALAVHGRRMPVRLGAIAIPALAALTLVVPAGETLSTEAQLRSGLDLAPVRGGPLTVVTARARVDTDVTRLVSWDGAPVTTSAFLQPLRPFAFGGATRVDLLPALSDYRPGVHQIGLRAGDDLRRSTFQILPPSGLQVTLIEDHLLVSGGPPNADVDILTTGPAGPELLHRRLDGSGAWRSPRTLTDASHLSVIAQTGDSWAAWTAQP